MGKRSKNSIIWDYIWITVGTILMAFSLVFLLEPKTIAPGGVTGLAIIIQKISGIPIDVTNLVVNIPLFLAGIMVLGKKFGAKTAYGTLVLSLCIRGFMSFFPHFEGINDLLLSSLYGGVVMGVGIGLVFKVGGTTGGTDLAGAILNRYIPHLSIAKLMMAIDLTIVIGSGIVNKKLETALYSLVCLYIIVKIADFIVDGLNYAKAFFIISNHSDEIGEKILNNLSRGATVLNGQGLYTRDEKNVIFCIVDRSQVIKLKELVNAVDPHAFVIVATVHEVLGEGFRK